MPVIYCYVDAFSFYQKIEIKSNNSSQYFIIDTKNLSSYLLTLCEAHGVNEIHLFGITKQLEGIKSLVLKEHFTKYNNNNLRIEVNK